MDTDSEREPEPGLPRGLQTVGMRELALFTALGFGLMAYVLVQDYSGVLATLSIVLVVLGAVIGIASVVAIGIRWRWLRRHHRS